MNIYIYRYTSKSNPSAIHLPKIKIQVPHRMHVAESFQLLKSYNPNGQKMLTFSIAYQENRHALSSIINI